MAWTRECRGPRAAVLELFISPEVFRKLFQLSGQIQVLGRSRGSKKWSRKVPGTLFFHRCFTSWRETWFSESWSKENTGMWSFGRVR